MLVLVPVPVGSPVDVVLLPVVEEVVVDPLVLLSPVVVLVLVVGGGGTGHRAKLSAYELSGHFTGVDFQQRPSGPTTGYNVGQLY